LVIGDWFLVFGNFLFTSTPSHLYTFQKALRFMLLALSSRY